MVVIMRMVISFYYFVIGGTYKPTTATTVISVAGTLLLSFSLKIHVEFIYNPHGILKESTKDKGD